jgi:hypothetical protein
MKTIFPFLLLAGLLLGCQNKELGLRDDCYSMGLNPEYSMEDFKRQYVIQFPSNFDGEGLYQDELFQPKFNKESPAGIRFYYYFPCATDCHIYFGRELPSPLPEEIEYSIHENRRYDETLNQKIEFCRDEEVSMALYYSSSGFDRAKLFMEDEGVFKEALTIELNGRKVSEVIKVLKTIKKK